MSLTVTLDRTTLAPGEIVEFTATFQNDSDEPMDYYVPWCGGAAEGRVAVALPLEPVGKRWTGIAQVFKDYVLTEAYGPGGVPALEPVSLDVIDPAMPGGPVRSRCSIPANRSRPRCRGKPRSSRA